MTELGPAARALLAAARDGLAPDAAAIKRVRHGVEASLATAAVGGVVAWKLGVVGLVAAIALGAAVHTHRTRAAAVAPRIEPPSLHAESVTAAVDPAPRAETAPPAASVRAHASPASPASPASSASPASPVSLGSSASPVSPGSSASPGRSRAAREPASGRPRAELAREVELIDQAMAALRRDEPARALAAIRIHAAETADAGQLAEDAAAIEIEALCRLHDPSAVAKLARFDARFPRSAQRSRLSCR